MRPVERGTAPRTYRKYGEAIGDLEARLGTYCSYCERPISVGLAVEHIIPKKLHPELETEWTNFLLSCTNCNSNKGDTPVVIEDFLWPERDNTFFALSYTKGGFVKLSEHMNQVQQEKAQALLDLVGLQRHLANGWQDPSPRDKRWQNREEVWTYAEMLRGLLEKLEDVEHIKEAEQAIIAAAKNLGFFSVWMTVFNDYPTIKKGIIKRLPGTALSCFDIDGNPINRAGGAI